MNSCARLRRQPKPFVAQNFGPDTGFPGTTTLSSSASASSLVSLNVDRGEKRGHFGG
jgi:hypothetical protein